MVNPRGVQIRGFVEVFLSKLDERGIHFAGFDPMAGVVLITGASDALRSVCRFASVLACQPEALANPVDDLFIAAQRGQVDRALHRDVE